MLFNDLLQLEGLDPNDVAIALHKPSTEAQRRALSELAENDPSAFDAYQSTHPSIPQATLERRGFLASFVTGDAGEMAFVGMYRNDGGSVLEGDAFAADASFARMGRAMGHDLDDPEIRMRFVGRLQFLLPAIDALSALRGRLVVEDPMARNFMRRADTTNLPVLTIRRVARIVPPAPRWDKFVVTTPEIRQLPREWAVQLAAWRGIYLIVDEADGARYVGAAYGEENLLGRWRTHVAKDKGITKELKSRDTSRFRFSILELLSPAATIEEVTALERTWMDRLHTIAYGLNA